MNTHSLTHHTTYILALAVTWAHLHGAPLWVTSLDDHIHMKDSLHFEQLAIDLDTHDLDGLATWLHRHTSAPYQVILERSHVHVEFDY